MYLWVKRAMLMLMTALFVNCAALDGYERRYGIAYYDEEGHKIEASVSLIPKAKPVAPPKVEYSK